MYANATESRTCRWLHSSLSADLSCLSPLFRVINPCFSSIVAYISDFFNGLGLRKNRRSALLQRFLINIIVYFRMWHTWESSPHASRSSPAQGRNASSTCNLAILNFNDPAALLRNARIVGDNDYRAAILMQFLEYAHNFLRCSGIQRSRWFIR